MPISPCPICLSESLDDKGLIQGYRHGTMYRIRTCRDCETSFSDPLKSDESLYDHIYRQVDKVPGYDRYARLAREIRVTPNPLTFLKYREDCYFGVIDFIQTNVKDFSALIVEIGCGQGYLTYALRQAGFNVVGLDLSEEGVSIAKSNFGDFYHCMSLDQYLKHVGVRPHLIICTELIEHLEDPIGFVGDMLSCCDSSGGLLITTPNKHRLEKSVWNTELPPVHLWWFGTKSLQIIAERVSATVQMISLRDFFDRNSYKPSMSSESDHVRASIFDANFQLIKPVREKSTLRKWLRKLETEIKKLVLRLIGQNIPRSEPHLPKNDEEIYTQSLCCFYQRR